MDDMNTIGTILFLVGSAIIILLFGYAIFIHWGLLGVIVYIAATCIFFGGVFITMD